MPHTEGAVQGVQERDVEFGDESLARTPWAWECYLGRSEQGTEGNYQGWGGMEGAKAPRPSLAA